jgi:hypothetical protein
MTAGSYGTAREKTKVRFFPLQRPRTEQKCRCADKAHAHHTRGHWSLPVQPAPPTHHAPCQPQTAPRSPAISLAHPPTSSPSAARSRPHDTRGGAPGRQRRRHRSSARAAAPPGRRSRSRAIWSSVRARARMRRRPKLRPTCHTNERAGEVSRGMRCEGGVHE